MIDAEVFAMSHFKHSSVPGLDKFWVVTVVSNFARFGSRYKLYKDFVRRLGNVNLLTVELAFGDRPFEVTEAGNPNHVQLRTWDELWHKENLINIGISHLPSDWEYVAWIDADIEFVREDWAEETVHQLQHHHVVQMFQTAVDLGPDGEALKILDGFVYSYLTGQPPAYSRGAYPAWHPGYAWAMRREAFDHLGGLIDKAILGAADHHMAWALIGSANKSMPGKIHANYKKYIKIWHERAEAHIKRDVGYVPGTILHYWHGKKADRKYVERWDVLIKHGFDPERDLKRDWQGIYILTDDGSRLRDDLRKYFRQRNEDSVDK
jgi:hypothetical protein